ncbi:30S ribosomal protein S16 [bacterium]|nr:30S ribosomal protein S16 [bacterium]
MSINQFRIWSIETVAVVIRMKRMGRTHRPFYRICATDRRTPRDGRVIEELGSYDPSVPDTNARCTLKAERVDYWLSVGAQPSDKVRVLIKKFGTNGTHLKDMENARSRLSMPRLVPEAGEPVMASKEEEPAADSSPSNESASEAPASEAPASEASTDTVTENAVNTDAQESPAGEPVSAEAPADTTSSDSKEKTEESKE